MLSPLPLQQNINNNNNNNNNNNSSVINSSNNLSSLLSTLPKIPPNDTISTIFIIGFPDDFRERELNNMFLFAPGFEGAVLKTTNISTVAVGTTVASSPNSEESQRKQLIGFVKFSKPNEAAYAMEILNGKILDMERGLVLKAEIAKKNLYIKFNNGIVGSSPVTGIKKWTLPASYSDEESFPTSSLTGCMCTSNTLCSTCTPVPPVRNNNNRVMNIMLPGQSGLALISAPDEINEALASLSLESSSSPTASVSVSQKSAYQPVSSSAPYALLSSKQTPPPPLSDKIIDMYSLQRNLITSPNLGSMAAIVGENFPCNTLYVGNLPPIAQEDELRALFRNCLGYRRLSFRPKSSGPMCFVEFEDIACATAAMETLYGTMISCSTPAKGGIRLSFSKNPLGLRVASPVNPSSTSTSTSTASPPSTSPSFMEAIGAETDNPDHRHAINTIFAHYFKINPHKSFEIGRQ